MIKGIVSFIIVVALGFGVWSWYQENVNYTGSQAGKITIKARESISSVSNSLVEAGLIKSKLVFKICFWLNDQNDLVAGNYSFDSGSSLKDIADRLGRGEADPEKKEVSN